MLIICTMYDLDDIRVSIVQAQVMLVNHKLRSSNYMYGSCCCLVRPNTTQEIVRIIKLVTEDKTTAESCTR